MAEPVKPRDWRSRRRETRHTREVHRVENLPKEVQDYLVALAETVNAHAAKLAELERRRDEDARETRRVCEALDQRISSVTVSIRRTA